MTSLRNAARSLSIACAVALAAPTIAAAQAPAVWKLEKPVKFLEFSPNGKHLIVSGYVRPTRLHWLELRDAATGKVVWEQDLKRMLLPNVTFTPDGKHVMLGLRLFPEDADFHDEVRFLDVKTGALASSIEIDYRQSPPRFALSPDGKLVASLGADRRAGHAEVRLWDTATGKLVHTLEPKEPEVSCLTFTPDGKRLATCGWSVSDGKGDVSFWDVQTGERKSTRKGMGVFIYAFQYTPDGKWLAMGTTDGVLKILDAKTNGLRLSIAGFTTPESIAFTPDSKHIAVADGNSVDLWDIAAGSITRALKGHTDQVTHLAYSPTGTTLATYAKDGTLRSWKLK